MEDYDFNGYEDYYVGNDTTENVTAGGLAAFQVHRSRLTEALLVVNSAICLLGVGGNGLVIWICGFRMKRTVTSTWYLSLAVSDFLFCAWMPFSLAVMASAHWPFGAVMCKLTSGALFLNMFSSLFLLVLISADRYVMVTFPVWAQNRRTIRRAAAAVALAWVLAATLSTPSLAFRQIKGHGNATLCYTDYGSASTHRVVALSRFVVGFAMPLLLIVSCYALIVVRLRGIRAARTSKPLLVVATLVVAFFACWLPYHIFVLLEIDHQQHSAALVRVGQEVGGTLAAGHSFLNPILYVLMGHDFRRTLRRSALTKMEHALREDGPASRCASRSVSVEARAGLQISVVG
ncbi:hypothetical protein AAFF_G00054570 [Aldrovandia affinis]|uniref:G-protein coupled receptors family 1 profile domain-containing protein n=1 Tax=Aldrovandia affinis TaxID=143900 RepID=A0AAD7S0T4_9TELE|nr:hypothetical protein AAFF_G00054570 [Aldrovandia affinis]